jgi:hypothetical protein
MNMDKGSASENSGAGGWRRSRESQGAQAGVLPDWAEPYVGLESAAESIRGFEVQSVPGLLQTESYAREQIKFGDAATEDAIDRRTRARIARQDILSRANPTKLWSVIDEGALRRPIGGAEVMREQLQHLIGMTAHPAVTLQVLPFAVGGHAALGGPFTILGLPGADPGAVVYLEQLSGAEYLNDTAAVDGYVKVMDRLTGSARPPADTRGLLADILASI